MSSCPRSGHPKCARHLPGGLAFPRSELLLSTFAVIWPTDGVFAFLAAGNSLRCSMTRLQRASRWPEQVKAMELWGRLLTAAIEGREANAKVVQ
jgi:hypothetical protein